VNAAQRLTQYIDAHPTANGYWFRSAATRSRWLPTCPPCATISEPQQIISRPAFQARFLPARLVRHLERHGSRHARDLHNHFSVEQAASFRAFDDPDRNLLVLFKLHPLPGARCATQAGQSSRSRSPATRSRFRWSKAAKDSGGTLLKGEAAVAVWGWPRGRSASNCLVRVLRGPAQSVLSGSESRFRNPVTAITRQWPMRMIGLRLTFLRCFCESSFLRPFAIRIQT